MRHADLLTRLYEVAKQESLSTARVHDLEFALESALLLAGRFDFDNATAILLDVLAALQAFSPNVLSLRLQARCLIELANIRRDQGQISGPGGAYALYERSRAIWQHLGELDKIALTTWYLGACNEMRKRHEEALKYYNEALDVVDAIGNLETLRGRILLRIGTVLTKIGALDKAGKKIRESLTLLEERVPLSDYGFAQQKLAIVHFSKGQKETSLRMVSDTLSMIPKADKFRLTQAKILIADLLFSIDEEDAGLEVASEAEALAYEYGFRHQLSALYSTVDKHGSRTTLTQSSEVGETLLWQAPLALRVYEILSDDFKVEDLRELSAELGISYDDLDGEDKSAKVRSLVIRMQLLDQLNRLAGSVHRHRPNAELLRGVPHG